MPRDDDFDASVEGEVIDEGAPAAGKTPNPVYDFSGLDERIAQGVSRGLQEMARQNQPPRVDPSMVEQTITEDDDETTRMAKIVHNAQVPLNRRLAQLESTGASRIAALTEENASRKFEYWNRYKSEISTELQKIEPQYRSDTATLEIVYNNIVARHMDDIVNERIEARQRQETQGGQAPAPRGNSRTVIGVRGTPPGEEDTPSPEELFGEEGAAMVNERGGPDGFAFRVSGGRFQNWSEYAKSAKALREAPRREGRVIIPFRKGALKSKETQQ